MKLVAQDLPLPLALLITFADSANPHKTGTKFLLPLHGNFESSDVLLNLKDTFFTLFSNQIPKLGHDIQLIIRVTLDTLGQKDLPTFPLPGFLDTLIAAWLLDPGDKRKTQDKFSYPSLCQDSLSRSVLNSHKTGHVKGEKCILEEIGVLKQDMLALLPLWEILAKKLRKVDCVKAFVEQEMPLVGLLAEMVQYVHTKRAKTPLHEGFAQISC